MTSTPTAYRLTITSPGLDTPVVQSFPGTADLRAVYGRIVKTLGKDATMFVSPRTDSGVVLAPTVWSVGRRGRYTETPVVDPRSKR